MGSRFARIEQNRKKLCLKFFKRFWGCRTLFSKGSDLAERGVKGQSPLKVQAPLAWERKKENICNT
jgi:hypothetical protein